MNPLVKKEIRLLLPTWIAAMLMVSVLPFSLQVLNINHIPYNPDILSIWFALGTLFLSLASFGQEFNSRTFPILLSQPIQRRKLWLVKTTILAAAFSSVLLVLFACYSIYFHLNPVYRLPFPFWILTLCGVVIFSGGLWTTLLLRRISEALWLTLLTPLAIMFALYAVHEHFGWSNQTDNYVIPAVLLLYSLAGVFWSRRLFLRAQDVQWTGGEIAFPSRKRSSERTAVSSRRRHWLSALIWKELQLHQVNILIATVMLVLNLTSVVIRRVHPNFANQDIGGLLELIWALWLLMPLLIGSVAVAEEHRLGAFESQLCLPISRRVQFAIKFFVALILSLILGAVMPFIIERTRDFNDSIFIVAVAIFFISFYASTLARTTLQAIGLAIVVAVALYFYEVATAVSVFKLGGNFSYERLGLELLKLYLGVPIIVLVLAWLMYWNFKWLHPEGKIRWHNGIAVLTSLAFIFVCTNAIYFRAWEFLAPVPSPTGPLRLRSSTEVKFAANGNAIYAVLPDGKLWVDTLAWRPGSDRWTSWLETVEPNKCKVQFIGGSNWIAVAANTFQAVGIRSDGSLWSLQREWNSSYRTSSQTDTFNLNKIGSETNWWQAAGDWHGFLLLKRDGSLWVWGTNRYDWHESPNANPKKLSRDLAMQPVRFGQQTDWVDLCSSGTAYARKRGGSIWEWNDSNGETDRVSMMVQNTNLDGFWPKFIFFGYPLFGINTNGQLWFYDELQLQPSPVSELRKVQLGPNAHWEVATRGVTSIVAIRSDGTLWNWPDCFELINEHRQPQPVQLGNYSNWIALPSTPLQDAGAFALSADGGLWIWDEPSGLVWLMPSRKPVYLGNIFSQSD